MYHITRRTVVAAAVALAVAFPARAETAYPDTLDGFRQLAADMLAAARAGNREGLYRLMTGLELKEPSAWFAAVYGLEVAPRLVTEYKGVGPAIEPELTKIVVRLAQEGYAEIDVLRLERGDGRRGPDDTRGALEAMQTPQPLYALQYRKPGEANGQTFYSFAYVDGGFRLLGRLRQAKAATAPLAVYPESEAGLHGLASAMLAAARAVDRERLAGMARALRLPNHEQWFKARFGDDLGGRLAQEYAADLQRLEPEIEKLFGKLVAENLTDIDTHRTEGLDDPKLVGAQRAALGAMREPLPLYGIRFRKPDGSDRPFYGLVHLRRRRFPLCRPVPFVGALTGTA